MDQAKRFVNIKYSNLIDFKKDCLTMNVLKVNNTDKTVTCFCSSGFKSGVCVHKLALEINLKFRQKFVLLVPKRKRGSKRKAATAMNYQQDDENLEGEPERFKKQGLGNRSEPITVILKKKKSKKIIGYRYICETFNYALTFVNKKNKLIFMKERIIKN